MIMIEICEDDERTGEEMRWRRDADDEPMREYLTENGWHFNMKAVEYAISLMRTRDGHAITPISKEEVDEMLAENGVMLNNCEGYDSVYVANMAKADFLKSSITDDKHLALYIKDTIDDADAPEGHVMRRWYADMEAKGEDVMWSDLL